MGNEWWMKDQHFKMEPHTAADVTASEISSPGRQNQPQQHHLSHAGVIASLNNSTSPHNRFLGGSGDGAGGGGGGGGNTGNNSAGEEEPRQSRSRANTWPLNHLDKEDADGQVANRATLPTLPTLPEEEDDGAGGGGSGSSSTENLSQTIHSAGGPLGANAKKKNSARRNPWGNMSYADLIERSIESAADKRLTLSQIYDWLVQNIPYFKEKADTNSSAGWKNSVRHNLSLHNRFMRVQNETGTGKSSWWMVNQSAKFDKPSRRRAASMETKEYAKHKGRMKKSLMRDRVVGEERNIGSPVGGASQAGPLDSTSPFQQHLSVTDFRSRASSNASSYGCLSPKSPRDPEDHPSPGLSPQSWSTGSTGYDSTGSVNGPFMFPYDGDFVANQLAKNVRISAAPPAFDQSPSRFGVHQPAALVGGINGNAAIGNYHPLSTNGFYDTPRAYFAAGQFATIPEEPRGVQGQYFHHPQQQQQPSSLPLGKIVSSTSVVAESGVSGGNFTTYTPVSGVYNGHHHAGPHHHHPHHPGGGHWGSLPQDLESFTEPVQSFDFDWEELLQQEAAIERNMQTVNSSQHQQQQQQGNFGASAAAGRFLNADSK